MVKMEKRIVSRVNPYVGARYPVHCSCCDSEVNPAITIERGYAVEAISLVEAVDSANETKPASTVTIKEIDNAIQVKSYSKEPQTMNMLSNTVKNASEDRAMGEGKTTTPMNITIKEAEVAVGNTGETKIKTPVTIPIVKAATGILDDPMSTVQENCAEEQSSQSGEGLDTPDVDEDRTIVSGTCMIPPKVCRKIGLALVKARFSLQKTNCATTKRIKELFQEQIEHVGVIKLKLDAASQAKPDCGIVNELYLVNQEVVKVMEYLKANMLDCQQNSLLEIIATLKQDVETELSTLKQIDVQENQQESDQNVETSDSVMTFLKDSSWTLFGLTSLLVANLGHFLQPWIFQSFHTCFVRYLDYFRNSTTSQ